MKKRIFSAFLAVLMIVLLVPVQAFAASKEIKGAYVDMNYETVIDTVVGATKFSKSGNIPEGMKLSGSWSYKNTYGDYVFQMSITGKPTKAGTYNFSVSYLNDEGKAVEKSDYVMVVGEKAPFAFITEIDVERWPDKTEYYLGDTVDLTGMKVVATAYIYNAEKKHFEPSVVDVTNMCWVEPAVFTFDETQNVMVYVKAPGDQHGNLEIFEDHFRVTFKYAGEKDILRMEIYKKPEKLTYTVGETLDTTGMVVRLHKGDGSAEDVTEGFKTDVTKLEEAGTKTVTVTYGEGEKAVTATFDVTVNEKVEEPVSSSSSSSEPEVVEPEPEVPVSSESEPEVPSEPSSESEPELPSESEPEVPSEPSSESESEPEEIIVIGGEEEPDDDKGGIPVWVWIIIVLLVVLVGAAVGLFIIGRKRIED